MQYLGYLCGCNPLVLRELQWRRCCHRTHYSQRLHFRRWVHSESRVAFWGFCDPTLTTQRRRAVAGIEPHSSRVVADCLCTNLVSAVCGSASVSDGAFSCAFTFLFFAFLVYLGLTLVFAVEASRAHLALVAAVPPGSSVVGSRAALVLPAVWIRVVRNPRIAPALVPRNVLAAAAGGFGLVLLAAIIAGGRASGSVFSGVLPAGGPGFAIIAILAGSFLLVLHLLHFRYGPQVGSIAEPSTKATPPRPVTGAVQLVPGGPALHPACDDPAPHHPRADTALPPGWQQKATAEGVAYFEYETGYTQWERPQLDPQASEETPASAPALPHGWTMLADGEGRAYYQNDATGETQWEVPAGPAVSGTSGAGTALPTGWTQRATADGVPYYECDATGATQWEPPTAAA